MKCIKLILDYITDEINNSTSKAKEDKEVASNENEDKETAE